jgi:hypothetical protein
MVNSIYQKLAITTVSAVGFAGILNLVLPAYPQLNGNQVSLRQVTVSGTIDIKDDETWPASDERETVPVSATGVIGVEPSSFVEMEGCAGDEVRVTLELNAQGAARNAVLITGTARLYEGTNCTTTDLEQEKSIRLTVPADSYAPFTINLANSGFGGGDTAKITLNFGNFSAP